MTRSSGYWSSSFLGSLAPFSICAFNDPSGSEWREARSRSSFKPAPLRGLIPELGGGGLGWLALRLSAASSVNHRSALRNGSNCCWHQQARHFAFGFTALAQSFLRLRRQRSAMFPMQAPSHQPWHDRLALSCRSKAALARGREVATPAPTAHSSSPRYAARHNSGVGSLVRGSNQFKDSRGGKGHWERDG